MWFKPNKNFDFFSRFRNNHRHNLFNANWLYEFLWPAVSFVSISRNFFSRNLFSTNIMSLITSFCRKSFSVFPSTHPRFLSCSKCFRFECDLGIKEKISQKSFPIPLTKTSFYIRQLRPGTFHFLFFWRANNKNLNWYWNPLKNNYDLFP